MHTRPPKPFSCPWDSGQIGWIVATRESLKSVGHENVDQLNVSEVEKWLEQEVAIYDQYLRGNVYGYILQKPVDCNCNCGHCGSEEIEDSCWGFYGDPNDLIENVMIEYMPEEVQAAIKNKQFLGT